MLQSEMLLSSADNEFQELISDFDTEQIDELRSSLDDLGNLIDKKPSSESKKVAVDTLRQYTAVFEQVVVTEYTITWLDEEGNPLETSI